MGLPLDPLTEPETIDRVLDASARGEGGWVCPVNLDVLRQWTRSGEVRRLVRMADVVVSDGMPLLWASRIAGRALPDRVAGSSLIWTLPRAAAERGATVFLLGGNDGVAEAAGAKLQQEIPGLKIAGTHCPPMGFERSSEASEAIDAALREAQPDIVFVALGFPKQEQLIERLRPILPQAWFISCGISLSFVTGEVSRAPRWIQRLGMEWLHRMSQEPKRLFRRYVIDGFPFLAAMLLDAARRRVGRH